MNVSVKELKEKEGLKVEEISWNISIVNISLVYYYARGEKHV